MTMHARWRLGAAALVILAVLLPSGAYLCGAAGDAGSRPLTTGALACAEFWLNRYQTLFGAITALIAAAVAWNGVRQQIDRADKQITVADRQRSTALLPILDSRVGYANSVYERSWEIQNIIYSTIECGEVIPEGAKRIISDGKTYIFESFDKSEMMIAFNKFVVTSGALDEKINSLNSEINKGLGSQDFFDVSDRFYRIVESIGIENNRFTREFQNIINLDNKVTRTNIVKAQKLANDFFARIYNNTTRSEIESIVVDIWQKVVILKEERDLMLDRSRD